LAAQVKNQNLLNLLNLLKSKSKSFSDEAFKSQSLLKIFFRRSLRLHNVWRRAATQSQRQHQRQNTDTSPPLTLTLCGGFSRHTL
jgi:hypothetical protein